MCATRRSFAPGTAQAAAARRADARGGQLVQATDTWVGVRNARIVLIDDPGVRARMAAAWLRQMGHRDVFIVEGGLTAAPVPARPPVAELAGGGGRSAS